MSPLMIRLQTEAQRAALEAAAEAVGLPVSTWARAVLLEAAGGPPVDEERLAAGRGLAEGDPEAARAVRRGGR